MKVDFLWAEVWTAGLGASTEVPSDGFRVTGISVTMPQCDVETLKRILDEAMVVIQQNHGPRSHEVVFVRDLREIPCSGGLQAGGPGVAEVLEIDPFVVVSGDPAIVKLHPVLPPPQKIIVKLWGEEVLR